MFLNGHKRTIGLRRSKVGKDKRFMSLLTLTTGTTKKPQVTGLLLCSCHTARPKLSNELLDEAAGNIPAIVRDVQPIKAPSRQKFPSLRSFLKRADSAETSKAKAKVRPKAKAESGRLTSRRKGSVHKHMQKKGQFSSKEKSGLLKHSKIGQQRGDGEAESTVLIDVDLPPGVDNETEKVSSTEPTVNCENTHPDQARGADYPLLRPKNPNGNDLDPIVTNAQNPPFENKQNDLSTEATGRNAAHVTKKRFKMREETAEVNETLLQNDALKLRKICPCPNICTDTEQVPADWSASHLMSDRNGYCKTAGCSAYLTTETKEKAKPGNNDHSIAVEEPVQQKGRYGVISLSDGVSSIVPILKKRLDIHQ